MEIIKSISLYYKQGTSDKQYNVEISKSEDGTYSVDARYGRRGNAVNSAPQGSGFTLEQAEAKFAEVVAKKKAKDYVDIDQMFQSGASHEGMTQRG